MKNAIPRRLLRSMFIAVGLFWSASSHAGIVLLDQFSVQRNGLSFFTDSFSNNLTPSQEAGTYGVLGVFPNGAESGGQLTLNSDWGALTANAPEQPRQTLGTQLLSNVNPANPGAGLNKGATIDVTGIFSLAVPAGPLINGYGLQVQDIIFGLGQDRNVELDVQYNAAFGGNVIRLLQQDFASNTVTTLGYVPFLPPAGADQIELNISRPDAASNNFYGAYAFGAGGVFDPLFTFAMPGTLFVNTDFVRARFINYTETPEPGTLTLVGFALAGLATLRRRKL